ncbi:VOC family protein [Aeromicrobium sp. YIM 150415]|uniref:VOC family protein n=1 Tax=Aeromicrobium sp. YIM 150415 TaxID=2803912 RepID=UPI00196504FA|nr:VOC family protein [Aeromicrobium sp. YIM 150415]MBM9464056.1 VOC family protein [Aeromicrobium sp. YIM 150415]
MSRAAVKSLNHVAIGVRDLQASLRFYVEGLGMRKTLEKKTSDLTPALMRLPEGTVGTTVFVQGDSRIGQLELVKWNLPETDGGSPKRPGDIGMGQLSFPVDPEHIEEVHGRLLEMGYEVYSDPTTTIVKNYGPVTLFLCEDPDGNQVELIALPSPETVREFRAGSEA